jgi:hypothetical protein
MGSSWLSLWVKTVPTFLAIVIAAFNAIYAYFHPSPDLATVSKAIGSITAILLLLAVSQVIQSLESSKEKDESTQEKAHARHLIESTQRLLDAKQSIVLENSPKLGAKEYGRLWGGFSQHYYAYNPAYRIESQAPFSKAGRAELIRDVFVPRYQLGCECYYLFFTQDDVNGKNLDYFKNLMRELEKYCSDNGITIKNLRQLIEVRQLNDRASADHPEVYFGTQRDQWTVIYELREPGATHGNPHYYCVVRGEEFFKLCKKPFDDDWGAASRVDIWH